VQGAPAPGAGLPRRARPGAWGGGWLGAVHEGLGAGGSVLQPQSWLALQMVRGH
jgi:hypothetical protein